MSQNMYAMTYMRIFHVCSPPLMPDGYELRELQPEHAEIVENCVKKIKYPAAYFYNGLSPELLTNFNKEIFTAYGGVGIYLWKIIPYLWGFN